MASLLVQGPSLGLSGLVQANALDPRNAAIGSQNLLYQDGLLKTPQGFAKVDLTVTGLNSGDPVLALFPYIEADRTQHTIAVTKQKIYRHNRISETWDDLSGMVYSSHEDDPISFAAIAHTDAIPLNDLAGSTSQYYHLVVCNGGNNNIQRWAGKYEDDFGDLLGGDGYNVGATTHRALQVGAYRSRLILISPLGFDSTTNTWVESKYRVRWPQVGKLETWTGTGSGYYDLLDTGDENVWSAPLGNGYVIYQKHTIWSLNYVGGTTVFVPEISMPNLGLLGHHLLASRNNVHYFVGDDYNVYAYYGGSVKETIGNEIHSRLKDTLSQEYAARCWMIMSEGGEWLWIFIVPTGQAYITQAYGRNMKTGAWTIKDFGGKFGTNEGFTSVGLIGAETYITGDTYQNALDTLSLYSAADDTATTAGDVTSKYGDILCDDTKNALDWSTLSAVADYDFSWKAGEVDFSEGGLKFCFSYTNDPTKLIDLTGTAEGTAYSGLIIRVDDGSDSDDMPNGSHYYQLGTVCSVLDAGTDYTITVYVEPCETTGTGIADTSADTPVLGGDTTATLYCPSGLTYNEVMVQVQTGERVIAGDATGFVYQFDPTYTQMVDSTIDVRHLTPVFDWRRPDIYKRWPGISVVADGTVGGAMKVRYRVDNFDTSDTGWTDFTFDLTTEFREKTFYVNRSTQRIQFAFVNYGPASFRVREFKILEPDIQDDR